MTPESPTVQPSPFTTDIRPIGVSNQMHSAPSQFDVLPTLPSVKTTESQTLSMTSKSPVDLTLPVSGVNLQVYPVCDSPLLTQRSVVEVIDEQHEGCTSLRNGTEDWMEIMQQLMSPDSTSSAEDSLVSSQSVHTTSNEASPTMYRSDSVLHSNVQTDDHYTATQGECNIMHYVCSFKLHVCYSDSKRLVRWG